jgi:CheY-like chemotaxis protein/predicted regulator of Ras-like GTPase activity (Roadblock/LC7/MglB family)
MPSRILVVDRNEAFATMLKELLETDGGYEVQVAESGTDALALLRRSEVDLTIVDMDLDPEEMDYQQLVADVRRTQPTMRLMLIPLMGEDLPPEARQLDIQGTLAKPFFADDLLPNISEALAKQVSPPPSQLAPTVSPALTPAPAQAPRQPLRIPAPRRRVPRPASKSAADIQSEILELARETNSDAVFLLSTVNEEAIIAHASNLDEDAAENLAELCITAVQAAGAVADYWKYSDVPFEHNMFESGSLRLYIMVLPENRQLVVIAPISTQLGTIRHNMRRAARALANLALT